jgi:hypothetical protein
MILAPFFGSYPLPISSPEFILGHSRAYKTLRNRSRSYNGGIENLAGHIVASSFHNVVTGGLPMEDETTELFGLANQLCTRVESHRDGFLELVAEMRRKYSATHHPVELERLAETFCRSLRHLWIEASASITSLDYRSPPTAHRTRTATGRNIEFGYERDLQPEYLEQRCNDFFDEPPSGWTSDSVLLSSGQSAMAAVLHALESEILCGGFDRERTLVHLGSYFETTKIISLFSSLLKLVGSGRQAVQTMGSVDADVFIIEPVYCDGEFGCVNVNSLLDQHMQRPHPRVYIFDTTLIGADYIVEKHLSRMQSMHTPVVFRLISGLKLLQGGMELSGVGVLTVFTPEDAAIPAKQLGDEIRKIRTLLGLGLSFADVAILEAPWFLDRTYTEIYQTAIFHNNARLARAVTASNRVFRGTFHPATIPDCQGPRTAPYCVFRLQNDNCEGLVRLEKFLECETRKRGVLFESGGSFGFRGHRFEVVRPEDGAEPFLRVALGRRPGWSCDQITLLMSEVGSGRLKFE